MPSPPKPFDAQIFKSETCWIWTGRKDQDGYGKFRVSGVEYRAHRVAWVQAKGPIPEGLLVLHRCDNRPCVRVDHLFLGTWADNIADMDAKGRRVIGWAPHRVRGTKLTQAQVSEIKQRLINGETQTALAADYNVSQPLISAIKLGKSWR